MKVKISHINPLRFLFSFLLFLVAFSVVTVSANRPPASDAIAEPAAQQSDRSNMSGDKEDLSGTYTGTVDYPDENLNGEATLTIEGDKFTLTSGSGTKTGTLSGVNTNNYVGAAMAFGEPGSGGKIVSVRAIKRGNSLTLKSVEGEPQKFSFTTSKTAMRKKKMSKKSDEAVPGR